MQTNATGQTQNTGGLYALIGIVLFGIGGMMLEDAMGSDALIFLGCASIAAGLVGVVAGGVSLGTSSKSSQR